MPLEIENDDEEEEEAEERSELDEDEETQPFEMFGHHMYDRHLSPSIPEIERDHEDILMIQYSNNAQNIANANNNAEVRENRTVRDRDAQAGGNISISVANNGTNANANEQPQNFLFNANFPLLYNENSEQGGNDNSNSAQGAPSNASNEPAAVPINTNAPPPNNHPLLSGRPDGAPTDRPDERLHVAEGTGLQTARRSGRARRYQFININSRNPPVILQRMLELRQNRQTGQQNAATGNGGTAGNDPLYFRDGTRVVVMDNGFSIFSNDDLDFEMLDQSGYWFGRTLANHLNNHPSALGWWQEENKISGPDSNSDLCMVVCDEMIPELDASRAAELSKIRGKRKKKPLEEEEAKQRNQDGKKTNEEESAEIHVQPEIALSTALASVPVPVEPIRVTDPTEETNQLSEDRSVETMQFVQMVDSVPSNAQAESSNNLNISFMDVIEENQATIEPITISTQVVAPPQHITTDNTLNLDLDVEMASDNEESSASANNSRSFSPNYSPNSNQIESGSLNMLNRETPAGEQQQQVNNLNIQDQSSQLAEDDHPMRGDTDAESEEDPPANDTSMAIEASNIPLPTDDDSDDSDSSDEDTEDEDEHDDEGAVGGTPAATTAADPANPAAENANATENAAESATGGGFITDMDPAIRAILGTLEVPEGVDPSFLAALPQEMRDEVIQEHVR